MGRVIDRLLDFIRYLKESGNEVKSAKAFEEKCGLSNSYIANVKKGNGSVGSDMLAKINLAFPQLNLEWLCSGNGGQIYAIYMQDNSVFFRYISMFDKKM